MTSRASLFFPFLLLAGACSAVSSTDTTELGRGSGGGASDSGGGGIDAGPRPGDDAGPGPGDAGPRPGDDAGPTPVDAGPMRVDAGPPPDAGPRDAGPPPTRGVITCGGAACSIADHQQCCIAEGVSPGEFCFPESDPDACRCEGIFCDETRIACDGRTDCGDGQVCCAVRGITTDVAERIFCTPTCRGGTVSEADVVCQGNAECPDGDTCEPDDSVPAGYRICR